jgi:hypothetical protein
MVFINAPQGRSARGALFFRGDSFGCGRGVPTLVPRTFLCFNAAVANLSVNYPRWPPIGLSAGVGANFFTLRHWLADGISLLDFGSGVWRDSGRATRFATTEYFFPISSSGSAKSRSAMLMPDDDDQDAGIDIPVDDGIGENTQQKCSRPFEVGTPRSGCSTSNRAARSNSARNRRATDGPASRV